MLTGETEAGRRSGLERAAGGEGGTGTPRLPPLHRPLRHREGCGHRIKRQVMLILRAASLQAGPSPKPGTGRRWDCHPPHLPREPPQHPSGWELAPGDINQHFCSRRKRRPQRFCCRHRAGEQAAGACKAPAKSWSWPKGRKEQRERPGCRAGRPPVLFIDPSSNSQQIAAEHPVHAASTRPVYAAPGELILTFSELQDRLNQALR